MRKYLLCFLCLYLFSCGTGRVKTLETKSTEVIVFGRVMINHNFDESEKTRLHFNERLLGKNTVIPDKNGYFYMKLPLGHNFLALIQSFGKKAYLKNISDNYISIDLNDSNVIYYLGDININWNVDEKDKPKNNTGGLISAIQEANEKGERPIVEVVESTESLDYLQQLFPDNNKPIIYHNIIIGE